LLTAVVAATALPSERLGEGAIGVVFSTLATEQPESVRYMSLKGSDGVTFIAVLESRSN